MWTICSFEDASTAEFWINEEGLICWNEGRQFGTLEDDVRGRALNRGKGGVEEEPARFS